MDLLANMISEPYTSHLLYVPSGSNFERYDPENEQFLYWGYLRERLDQHRKRIGFVLQIRQETLSDIGEAIFTKQYDWAQVVSQLKKKRPAFLKDVKAAFMPADEQERQSKKNYFALVLEIAKMDFLSEGQRQYLQSRCEGLSNEEAWKQAQQTCPIEPPAERPYPAVNRCDDADLWEISID